MLFNSPIYIFLFLPIAVLIYFLLNKHSNEAVGKGWLVLASLFFYGYWNANYLVLIIASMLVNYAVGSLLRKQSGEERLEKRRKRILILGIVFNLSLLGYFKYADFFIENINLFAETNIASLDLILPLAISFFTFQQIAYIVDCYKDITNEYDFLNYALFVTFFPQLIAGPIVHHKQMMPQFVSQQNSLVNWENIALGVYIFFIGLLKKVVIADTFAEWANVGFANTESLNFFDAWGASLSYTFQLYYDFSGYTDMAIGAALLFNIRLPVNFNSPYKAVNIQDFWRRWHITLSNWLRDYIYIPLGGSHASKFKIYRNIMLTFVLGGLWHGAGWTFILWGVLHGSALVIHRLWHKTRIKLPKVIAWFITFQFVNIAWIFFRADSVSSALNMIRAMADVSNISISPTFHNLIIYFSPIHLPKFSFVGDDSIFSILTLEYILIFGASALLMPNSLQIIRFIPRKTKLGFRETPLFLALLVLMASLSFLTFIGNASQSEFLYFNF